MDQEEIERSILWNSLVNLGSVVKLKFNIDYQKLEHDLIPYQDLWVPYNQKKDKRNNRWGLPVTSRTGELNDTEHLNSFGYALKYRNLDLKEQDFNKFTDIYFKIPDLKNLIDIFNPDIGRIHFLRIDQGGFFPPHRDFIGCSPDYFRLILTFGQYKREHYHLMIDNKSIDIEPGHLYFLNFQLNHSIFSFVDGVYVLILTLKLNKRIFDLITHNTIPE
jgi:hypothetical protein